MGLEPDSTRATRCQRLTQLDRETDRDHGPGHCAAAWHCRARRITAPRGRLKDGGVDDGTRTHDDRDHNPGLYQLSYAHH